MQKLHHMILAVLLFLVLLGLGSCGRAEEPGGAPEQNEAVGDTPVAPGEDAWLHMQNDSMVPGTAIMVRGEDGTKEPALFFGPRKLAEQLTNGTFEFDADSLHVRVKLMQAGDSLRGRR